MKAMSALMQRLGKQRWFADLGRKLVPLDLALQRRTGGRASLLSLAGLPYLVLTTTGRQSGRPRSVPLLYVRHGGGYAVVGSNWGRRSHPAWSANLLANPDAIVLVRGQEVPVRARQAMGEERDAIWRKALAVWSAYATYADRAGGRELRVFVLSPQ